MKGEHGVGAQTPTGAVTVGGYMENEGDRGMWRMKGRKKPRHCEWGSKLLTVGAARGLGRFGAQVQGGAGEGD